MEARCSGTGSDSNAHSAYRDHPFFDACTDFFELYDQKCFAPAL